MTAPGGETTDFRDYLRLLRRRAWILVACLVIIPVAAYVYTDSRPKVFEASTLLQVNTAGIDTGVSPDFSQPQSNIQAVATFVSTSAVADEAARRLGLPPGSLLGAASADADEETGFVTLTATGPTSKRAADTANAFAEALNAAREKRGREAVGEAIARARQQLSETPKDDLGTRSQLRQELQKLEALNNAQSQNLQVLQPAAGASQIAPHPKRNATVAIILALLIGVGLIALIERFDRQVHKPEDLEQVAGVPFLATIPGDAFDPANPSPAAVEAFQTLRNSLTYFNIDGELSSLAVVSSLKGEGKTTVALNLALSYANFGKNVILVDTDLRKPDVARRLGLPETVGLSQVLVGTAPLHDAVREVGMGDTQLRVLPGGPIPPNPSALIGSSRMKEVLDELQASADLVILDTTPLLVVSDAFPLLDQASGIVALARLDQSPRDAIRRMVQICATAGGRVLGVVATGGADKSGASYGYGYGYGLEGESKRRRLGLRRSRTSNGGAESPAAAPLSGAPAEDPRP
jgi:capsular exopolysaccharide synthesis family protein